MKRILSFILCAALILCLCSCGNQTATSSLSPDSSQVSSDISSAVSQTVSETEKKEWFKKGAVVFTQEDLEKAKNQKYVKPKNVIIFIGDGMGLNDLTVTKKYSEFLFDFGLLFDQLPNVGKAVTGSLSGVTDSAAAATALATGYKTTNGFIGLDKDKNELKNAPELAREMGKKVGIVTNDTIYGATPAAFTLHAESRDNTAEILQKFAEFRPEVLMGAGYSEFRENVIKKDENKELVSSLNIASSDIMWESTLNKDPECKKPFFGFMDVNHATEGYQLAQATQVALNRLENEKGFFLMVECASPDKGGHANAINQKRAGVANLDKAVAVAVQYCIDHPDTLLIVTSDHETGGVAINGDDFKFTNDLFSTTNHTGVDVGVFALGYGTEYFKNKTVDNTDIAKFMHAAIKGEKYN